MNAVTTLLWGTEFGRTPGSEGSTGRDHHPFGFSCWLAGGGIRGGVVHGTTDELGSAAVEEPLHVKRLHATVLRQLGFDPNALSYFYRGLDQRLVGPAGADPIHQLIA